MIEEREGERICSNKVGRAKALVVVFVGVYIYIYNYIEQMYFLLFYGIYLSIVASSTFSNQRFWHRARTTTRF